MYVATIPNRSSPPAILLRESYRAGGKVKSRTLANLTHWPPAKIAALRRVLVDEPPAPQRSGGPGGSGAFEIQRSLPHGHVAAVLGTLRRLGLEPILATKRSAARDAVVALIVARVIAPRSKLATARGLDGETAFTSLGEALGLSTATPDELYAAMDWLLPRQPAIEQALASRHLAEQTLVLYDVTSTYFEGRTCPLARFGHSRDGRKDKLQIVFGLLCNAAGCPVAVEVFDGNTADPKTLTKQIEKIQQRFGLQRVVPVCVRTRTGRVLGDRGMLTAARIERELRPKGLDWITALRAPAIRALADAGVVQPSLFDERDLAEITAPAYPGERLVACRNPLLAEERARKRKELLAATEQELDRIVAATGRSKNRLRGQDQIGLRVGKVLNRFKMGKHFRLEISTDSFRYQRDDEAIVAEAALDGIYIVRTSLPADTLKAEQTVRAYKGLAVAERAFRSLKTVDLKVRPIHHRLADRVRAHVLLCTLAYYVEWHMRQALAPLLFDDDDQPAGEARRLSVVAPARRSARAARKAATQKTEHEQPVHSFQTLLADLATLAKNRVRFAGSDAATMTIYTQPTPLQQHALDLLQVSL